MPRGKFASANQKHHPDLGSQVSQLFSQVRSRGARGLITSENKAVDLMFGCITGDYGDHETIKFFKAPSSLLDRSMSSWKYYKEESKCL